jgi:enamine deaminase RidA (YjgF/YER057c/UK114 family)
MDSRATLLQTKPMPEHCECSRRECDGEVVAVTSDLGREVFIRCNPATVCRVHSTPHEQAEQFYSCLPHVLAKAGATMADVVLERVFFRKLKTDFEVFADARQRAYQTAGVEFGQLPLVSCAGQAPCRPGQAFELQVYALIPQAETPASVTSIPAASGLPAAKVVEIGGVRHFYVSGIQGQGESFRAQSDSMFARAAEVLTQHGATFDNVLRTWCYLKDMDRDYAEFNASRNEFFRQHNITRFPASTGICADLHPHGIRCGMDLYALLTPRAVRVEVMHARTLNEASEYGSAFSRGMKVCLPDKIVLYISGTASVDEAGQTVHVGQVGKQFERMLLNVQKLLEPHGAGFGDLVQVISYLKSSDDLHLSRAILARHGLANLPNSIVEAGVCRPDLLCEMEAIAILPA